MTEAPQPNLLEAQSQTEQEPALVDDSIATPRIEIPGLLIEHLDHSPESMNIVIDELLEEASRRSEYGGPEDLYHEAELGNERSVVFQIRTEGQLEDNDSKEVDCIQLKFRNDEGSGFEYWLSDAGLVMLYDKSDGNEETVDLFNNYKGGEREYETGLSEEMQEHSASAVAAMRAMMDRATMGYPTTYWQRTQ